MMKTTLWLLALLLSFSSVSAERYILVTIHGLGGYNAQSMDENTNIPDVLSSVGIEKSYNGGHGVNKKKFRMVLDNFKCQNGIQKEEDLGLIIIGYSWGAKRSYDLSKAYYKKCGRKAERAYMLDGVQKLITPFRKTPIAKVCKNWFKTIHPIRGTALKNCENFDRTEICILEGGRKLPGMKCHQAVLKEGYKLVMEDIQTI